jgi:hypothetical protein
MRFLTALLLAVLTSSLSAAPLAWEKTSVELIAKPDEKTITATFRYTNATRQPVRITSAVAGCDCTTPTVSQPDIAPGASGELVARVALAGASGHKETTLTVITDDDATHPQLLRIVIAVPELVAFSSRLLFWSPGQPPTPKSIAITLADLKRVRIEGVQTESKAFRVALERDTDPRALRVRVEPIEVRDRVDAVIYINAVLDDHSKQFVLYAAAPKPPPSSTPRFSSNRRSRPSSSTAKAARVRKAPC